MHAIEKFLVLVKVKDGNKVSGKGRITCPLYEEIDAILGNRAASSPPVVVESGSQGEDDASPSVEGEKKIIFFNLKNN